MRVAVAVVVWVDVDDKITDSEAIENAAIKSSIRRFRDNFGIEVRECEVTVIEHPEE